MLKNNYLWNVTLKFSPGHIVAFVALIFISYIVFMGDFYANGNFMMSVIKVLLMDVALMITFIGAQRIKGTDKKFDRSIIVERLLICLCLVVYIYAMIPYNHFWNVYSNREEIEIKFNCAIDNSRQMFVDYDKYAANRISSYSESLSQIIWNRRYNPDAYFSAGFIGKDDEMIKDNYVETLNLQLSSKNVDDLEQSALEWLNEANQGATVWNVFLIGNVRVISDAVGGWYVTLYEVSQPLLGNENYATSSFCPVRQSYESATSNLMELEKLYANSHGISFNTIWSSLLLFVMLLFPYFFQSRNTRANGLYHLIPFDTFKFSKFPNVSDDKNKTQKSVVETSNDPNAVSQDNDLYNGTF